MFPHFNLLPILRESYFYFLCVFFPGTEIKCCNICQIAHYTPYIKSKITFPIFFLRLHRPCQHTRPRKKGMAMKGSLLAGAIDSRKMCAEWACVLCNFLLPTPSIMAIARQEPVTHSAQLIPTFRSPVCLFQAFHTELFRGRKIGL